MLRLDRFPTGRVLRGVAPLKPRLLGGSKTRTCGATVMLTLGDPGRQPRGVRTCRQPGRVPNWALHSDRSACTACEIELHLTMAPARPSSPRPSTLGPSLEVSKSVLADGCSCEDMADQKATAVDDQRGAYREHHRTRDQGQPTTHARSMAGVRCPGMPPQSVQNRFIR